MQRGERCLSSALRLFFNISLSSSKIVDVLKRIGLFLFIFGGWLAARPYDGIWHDSILYTVQALKYLQPEVYSQDLFFSNGAQDQFTIFPAIHAYAIRFFGVYPAAKILTVFGKLIWFLGLILFFSSFLSRSGFWLGLAIAASSSPFFDGHGVFSYGESFLTARLYAEAVVMASLALFLRNERLKGGCGLFFSTLLHPLVALVGVVLAIVVILLASEKKTRLLIWLLVAFWGLLFLAVCGMPPFGRLMNSYDEVWLSIVRSRNPYVFLAEWGWRDLSRVVLVFALLLTAGLTERGVSRSFALAAGIVLLLLVSVTWFGGDVFNNVLLTQLQLWRGFWLIQLIAWGMLGNILVREWRTGNGGLLVPLALLISAVLMDGVGSGPLALFAYFLLLWIKRYLPNWKAPPITRGVVSMVLAVSFSINLLMLEVSMRVWVAEEGVFWHPFFFNFLSVVFVVGLAVAYSHKNITLGILPIGVGVFMVGAVSFLGKPDPAIGIDARELEELQRIIPPGASVYKPGGLVFDWFYLQRAHYASGLQTAGVLFSRDTAIESNRRLAKLWTVGFSDGNPYWPGMLEASAMLSKLPGNLSTRQTIEYLCGDNYLDYLMLPRSGSYELLSKYIPLYENRRLRLYECASIRDVVKSNGKV